MNNKLNVIDREGNAQPLEWEPEQSLMEALRDNDLPVLASCGGTASCATCHVYIPKNVVQSLGERSEDEIEVLAEAEGFDEECSRLSCQIGFAPELDGMTVTLAPED
ncbi:Chloroacetanilide N-alkylformylase 2, ferredoxin component [Arthrobacter sp. 9AX]|uniref:2Fe-2S iron-sulfur cluster-binding protein n=1 Tax=Arthrobacter sp. 9AX TaxID=2653131 RepID=UPI0012F2426D|nr:2Fe-2S iron-sulfur cluster-binding protein [Arthrobacter sp. 9AX]VXC12975.1 Chloroacetanilide N-alkylformylase 2, ferredoxin component [Arthrobacter sp. 9AX]